MIGRGDEGTAGCGHPERSTSARVALVTGASRGIGAEVARLLGAAGIHVVVNYREKAKRAQVVVDDIPRPEGGRRLPVPTSVMKCRFRRY
ncbi:MAG: short-chain dehydrogenase [Mycobacterium sp.]|nr:short-chain dehydrogenase [Mycobacterium sp.]